eukprot:Gregarina_sp_Pseudo_9__4009@NODE_414_length_2884_cov_138_154657_g391_i0_p1_GENE_NODE_414_length_2884_cov_138_154657_g391_i0NODE_414_length_2884_cov_138_154657_g391_i0_p1_ORF_typecomplete_len461_score126_90_NODE_414_length_2884_cov_138_154657_g391_i04701852
MAARFFLCLVPLVGGWTIEEFTTLDPRPECWPQQCVTAQTERTWDSVVKCRDAGFAGCVYNGKFVYVEEPVADLAVAAWQPTTADPAVDAGVIVYGKVPFKSVEEMQGFQNNQFLHVHLAFDPPLEQTGAVVDQCVYVLSLKSATTPTKIPAVWDPAKNSCQVGYIRDGFPLNDTLETFAMNARHGLGANQPVQLWGMAVPNNELRLLVQPTGSSTVTSVTLDGFTEFSTHSVPSQQTWAPTSVEVSVSLSPSAGGDATLCALALGSDSALAVSRCVASLPAASGVYAGSFAYETLAEAPPVSCRLRNKLWASLTSLSLIGAVDYFHADRVTVRMKTRASEACQVRLLAPSADTPCVHCGVEKCASLSAADDEVALEAPVGQLEADAAEFVLSDVNLSRGLLGLSFSAELGHCGTAIDQVKVENGQVGFVLDLTSAPDSAPMSLRLLPLVPILMAISIVN